MLSPSHLAEKYGLIAKKSLGQNFLFDVNITRKIVRLTPDIKNKNVIEIGPGPGGLSAAIVEATPQSFTAIEYDPRAVEALGEYGDKIKVLQQDALRIDLREIAPQPVAVLANLPYNIGTKLLTNWFEYIQHFDSLTLMFQKEVAERIISQPNSPEYGRLSVMAQWLCDIQILFDIPPQAFTPPPKVTSSVILLIPKKKRINADKVKLERLLKASFGQRRKMLRVSLKTMVTEAQFEAAGISPLARPQELSVADFCALSNQT